MLLMRHAKLVNNFSAEKFLKLIVEKCEVIIFGIEGGVSPNSEDK